MSTISSNVKATVKFEIKQNDEKPKQKKQKKHKR